MELLVKVPKSYAISLADLFEECLASLQDLSSESLSLDKDIVLYRQIHRFIYADGILIPEDQEYVGNEGSDLLLEQSVKDQSTLFASCYKALDECINLTISDVRQIYILLEDLNAFFHQPGNFESSAPITKFLAKNHSRVLAAIDKLQQNIPRANQG